MLFSDSRQRMPYLRACGRVKNAFGTGPTSVRLIRNCEVDGELLSRRSPANEFEFYGRS